MTRSPRDQLGEYTEELRCSWSWTEWPAREDEEGFCAESLSFRGCFFVSWRTLSGFSKSI